LWLSQPHRQPHSGLWHWLWHSLWEVTPMFLLFLFHAYLDVTGISLLIWTWFLGQFRPQFTTFPDAISLNSLSRFPCRRDIHDFSPFSYYFTANLDEISRHFWTSFLCWFGRQFSSISTWIHCGFWRDFLSIRMSILCLLRHQFPSYWDVNPLPISTRFSVCSDIDPLPI
jgi:hypothetical protein